MPQRIRDAAAERGLRLQLIRRHGRYAPDGRTCYLGWSAYDQAWIERRRLGRLDDVLDADLDALAAGRRPGFGEPGAEARNTFAPSRAMVRMPGLEFAASGQDNECGHPW